MARTTLTALTALFLLLTPALAARTLTQSTPTKTCDPYSSYPNQCFNAGGTSSICCPAGKECIKGEPGPTPACEDNVAGVPPTVTPNDPANPTPTPTPTNAPSTLPPTPTASSTPMPTGQMYTGFPEFAPTTTADVSSFQDTYHKTLKFAVIGDVGRVGGTASEGADQCSKTDFTDDDVQGAAWQRTTAKLLADKCDIEKCAFIVNTGDNFYECGVYPNDNSRLKSDIYDVYNPYVSLSNLVWHSTLGNHDMVINGSMEQEMSFNSPQWYLPAANFVRDFKAGSVSVRAIFYDENPWIASYKGKGKYDRKWYNEHSNQVYADAVVNFVQTALSTSTATHTIVVSHYPLFGSATEYGRNPALGLFNVFPRIVDLIKQYKPAAFFNGHDHVLTLGQPGANFTNGYTSYVTTGAGGIHGYPDACGPNKQYSNGGNGGFVIVEATQATLTIKYYTTGSAVGSIVTEDAQCTVTSDAASKTTTVGSDCASNTLPRQDTGSCP